MTRIIHDRQTGFASTRLNQVVMMHHRQYTDVSMIDVQICLLGNFVKVLALYKSHNFNWKPRKETFLKKFLIFSNSSQMSTSVKKALTVAMTTPHAQTPLEVTAVRVWMDSLETESNVEVRTLHQEVV